MRIPKTIVRLKFWFDMGWGVAGAGVLCSTIVAGESDKLAAMIGVTSKLVILAGIPALFVSLCLFGFVLDKLRYNHHYTELANERNEMMQKLANGKEDRT